MCWGSSSLLPKLPCRQPMIEAKQSAGAVWRSRWLSPIQRFSLLIIRWVNKTQADNTHTHTRTHARTGANKHALTHICTRTHTHAHTHTHTHTHTEPGCPPSHSRCWRSVGDGHCGWWIVPGYRVFVVSWYFCLLVSWVLLVVNYPVVSCPRWPWKAISSTPNSISRMSTPHLSANGTSAKLDTFNVYICRLLWMNCRGLTSRGRVKWPIRETGEQGSHYN